MQRLLRFFNEAKRRLGRGDKDGTRRAAKVIEKVANELARKGPKGRFGQSLALLRARASLFSKFTDPVRLGALRAACVSCHHQQGLKPLLPPRR